MTKGKSEVGSQIEEVKNLPRKKRFLNPGRILSILLVLGFAISLARAQTADELIAKNLTARGGAAKLRAVQSMLMTGTLSFGDTSSPLTVKCGPPNRIREDFEIQGAAMIRAYNGAVGWMLQESQVHELNGGDLDNIREEAENAIEGPLLDYDKKGSKAEVLGKDTVAGKPVYKLKITTKSGTAITQFLDAASYLEIHEEIERSANGKTMVIVEDVSDYRDVEGIQYAHRFVSGPRDNPSATTLQIETMQLNVAIESAAFDKPAN